MAQDPQLFMHTFNSAWLVLATHEAVQPPYIYDLGVQLGGLVDEGSPLVIIEGPGSDSEEVKALLDRLQDAFAPGETTVSALDNFVLDQRPGRVGVLILFGGSPQDWLDEVHRFQSTRYTADMPFIDLTIVIGGACAAAGEWKLTWTSPDAIDAGLGWLPKGIVTPGLAHPADLPAVRELLATEVRSFAIGLPAGASLALGPSGELEIWGEVRPGMILGRGWGQS